MGVEVECVKDLQRLCQTKANITRLAVDPAKCTVRGEGRETAEVGETAEVTLTTKLTNNRTTRHSVAVVSKLKTLRDGSVVKCTVDQSGPGEYNIKYTPTVRGCHELTVSVDGQEVKGSPFSMLVSISPTQLGKPVKMWTGLSCPYGITVNSEGETIVCEYWGDIIKIDKGWKKHVIVKHSTTTLSELSYVATDKEDNIYRAFDVHPTQVYTIMYFYKNRTHCIEQANATEVTVAQDKKQRNTRPSQCILTNFHFLKAPHLCYTRNVQYKD